MNQVELPANVLGSYHYLKSTDPSWVDPAELRMIADSGAFSAANKGVPIDLEKLYDWYRRGKDVMFWQASLDVIGDQDASWRNWSQRPDDLPNLVPTIHYPDEPRLMDRYVEAGADLIGLGGMAGKRVKRGRLMPWLVSIFRYARDKHPHVRFHGWGVNNPVLTLPLPWWSVDSTKFGTSYRYGQFMLWNPGLGKLELLHMNGRQLASRSRVLEREYGADWREFLTSDKENRVEVTMLSFLSCQSYQRHLQQTHRVTPPASLAGKLEPGTVGPFVHYVASGKPIIRDILNKGAAA